jgi:hypothetical protein
MTTSIKGSAQGNDKLTLRHIGRNGEDLGKLKTLKPNDKGEVSFSASMSAGESIVLHAEPHDPDPAAAEPDKEAEKTPAA